MIDMNATIKTLATALVMMTSFSCSNAEEKRNEAVLSEKMDKEMIAEGMDTATLGAGCFWCIEAVFQELKGVESVTSGYAGGFIKNPSYKEVCTGRTGHAEVAQIVFDPDVISFDELLEVFWKTHDPTTLNRQGNDIGTQYRSSVFYHNEKQKEKTEYYKRKLDESGADGIIPLSKLGREYWQYDDQERTLKGQDSGRVISIGMSCKVSLVDATAITGGISLEMLELEGKAIPKGSSRQASHNGRRISRSKDKVKRKKKYK